MDTDPVSRPTAPVRKIHRIPFSTSRGSLHGRPRWSLRMRGLGKSGASTSHCFSERSTASLDHNRIESSIHFLEFASDSSTCVADLWDALLASLAPGPLPTQQGTSLQQSLAGQRRDCSHRERMRALYGSGRFVPRGFKSSCSLVQSAL